MTKHDRIRQLQSRLKNTYGEYLNTSQLATELGLSICETSRRLSSGHYDIKRHQRGKKKCATYYDVAKLMYNIEMGKLISKL